MKILFKNIEEVNRHLSTTVSVSFETIKPRLMDAHRRLLTELLPAAFVNDLILKYESMQLSDKEAELVSLIQYPLVHAAFAYHAPDMNVTAKSGGFTVNVDEKNQAASGYRVMSWIANRNRDAQKGFDIMLQYLDDNHADFSGYTNSDERKNSRDMFLNRTEEINEYVTIRISRYVLWKMRPTLKRIMEWQLRAMLGPQLYDYMITQIKTGASLGAYAPILPLVQRALAHDGLANAIEEVGIQLDDENGAYIAFQKNANEPNQTKPIVESGIDRIKMLNSKLALEAYAVLRDHLLRNHATYPFFESSDAYTGTLVKGSNALESTPGFVIGIGFSDNKQ